MISCGSEPGWGLAVWPRGLVSSVTGEMHGLPELCFTDGPQEARGCCAASDLLRPRRWFSPQDSKEPKGTSG